ncbi:unnamed protein product [Hymenolepis diminuta]|uniref:Uncharacterized protein n=1 Tax=Hymenolepis diminuta TaxID=6216 RepID=A0A564YIH8_HYMDI|nr:unnamed protein product [Hymenolepis diminuta]
MLWPQAEIPWIWLHVGFECTVSGITYLVVVYSEVSLLLLTISGLTIGLNFFNTRIAEDSSFG